jgi:hypothetical protein
VKKVITTACTRRCFESFTLWHWHVLKNLEEGVVKEKKCPAEKNPNRAGATPLFGLSAAQKVFGVAPALGTVSGASDFFRRAQRVSEIEP